MIESALQEKLSAALGMEVSFGKLGGSLLGGTVTASDVTIRAQPADGDDPADPLPPVLTVATVRAELSVRQALKGRFVVRSLEVDRPVLTLARDVDGRTNLPPPPSRPTPAGDADGGATMSDRADAPARFDVEHLKLAGGEVRVRVGGSADPARPPRPFAATVAGVDGEADRAGDAVPFTLSIGSAAVDRPDAGPIDLGRLQADGRLAAVADLASLGRAGLDATVTAGDGTVRATVRTPSLARPDLAATLAGSIDLAATAAFLAALEPLTDLLPADPLPPAARSLLASAASGGVAGRVTVDAEGFYTRDEGLRLARAEVTATDLRVATPPTNLDLRHRPAESPS